jgi:hypothetical protein
MAKDQTQQMKIAVIAGAAEALDYREKHPKEGNDQAIQHVTKKMREIIKKIEKEEYE